jgi:hypothetical protein
MDRKIAVPENHGKLMSIHRTAVPAGGEDVSSSPSVRPLNPGLNRIPVQESEFIISAAVE